MMPTKTIAFFKKLTQGVAVASALIAPSAVKADQILFRPTSFVYPHAEDILRFARCVGSQRDGRDRLYIITDVNAETISAVNPDGKICTLGTFFAEGLKFSSVLIDDGRDSVIEKAWKTSEYLDKEKKANRLAIIIESGTRHYGIFHVDLDKIQDFFTKFIKESSALPTQDQVKIDRLLRTVNYLIKVREITSENHATLMQHLIPAIQVAMGTSRFSEDQVGKMEGSVIAPLIADLERRGKGEEARAFRQEFDAIRKSPRDADYDRKLNAFWFKVIAIYSRNGQEDQVSRASEKNNWDAEKKRLEDSLAKHKQQIKELEDKIAALEQKLSKLENFDPGLIPYRNLVKEWAGKVRERSAINLLLEESLAELDSVEKPVSSERRNALKVVIANAEKDLKKLNEEIKELEAKKEKMEKELKAEGKM